jgi:hypothetical protein
MQTILKSGIVQHCIHPTLLLTWNLNLLNKPWLILQGLQLFIPSLKLKRNNTWPLFSLPPNWVPIGCKRVFQVKENPDGSINKDKERLVAKGLHQQFSSDYTETFSPFIKPVT